MLFALLLHPMADAANNLIVVGQAIDLSGPNAAIGRDYAAGVKTWFDAVNASGGIGGKRVHYVLRDDRGTPEGARSAVAELIERDQVDYLFGGVGDDVTQAVLASPAFRRSGLTLYAPLAEAGQHDGARVLFWRPGYQQEVRQIFSHFGKLGAKDVAVVYQESPSRQEAFRGLSNEIRERGMKLAGIARISANSATMAAEAQRLAAAKPGFVVLLADTIASAQFLKEFRRHDALTFVAGTSLVNLATLREVAGARAVDWTVFSQVVPDPTGTRTVLQSEHLTMMRKYRDEPASALTLEGFAAAKTLGRAIAQSRKGGHNALQELTAPIDLGGMTVSPAAGDNHLSGYVDIALFRKGGLVF